MRREREHPPAGAHDRRDRRVGVRPRRRTRRSAARRRRGRCGPPRARRAATAGTTAVSSTERTFAERRSSSRPTSRSLPPSTTPTRSQSVSTSGRMCVEKKTVLPRRFSSRMRSRISLRPTGSSPLIGSSSTTNAGSPTSACAMPEPLLHALRVLADLAVGGVGEADHAEQLVAAPRALRGGDAGQAREELQRLGAGEELVVGGVLGEVADALLRALARDRVVEDEGLAARRVDEPHQHLDGGRLPGAVRPDEPEDLALPRRRA